MAEMKVPIKCEFRGCESTMFHMFPTGEIQCVQCGGWQERLIVTEPPAPKEQDAE